MRKSPVHYIAPSAISIVPNVNGSYNDLAVHVAKGAKIKVYSPAAGIGMEDSTYQEWTFAGRNRRLAESEAPYTIYVRLRKAGTSGSEETSADSGTDGYLVFVGQVWDGDRWKDKYPYVTEKGLASDTVGADTGDYWYVRLGEVSVPEDGKRSVTLDTGILGTDQYNTEWVLNQDDNALHVDLDCSINERDAGPSPCLAMGQTLLVHATLAGGWYEGSVYCWTIKRVTGNAESDDEWNSRDATSAQLSGMYDSSDGGQIIGRLMEEGYASLSNMAEDDDFDGSMSAVFIVTAWSQANPKLPNALTSIASASVNVLAEMTPSLSKLHDDEAHGVITFLKGLLVGAARLFGIDAGGNATLNNVTTSEDVVVGRDLNVAGVTTANDIKSDNYTGDSFADSGFRIYKDENGITTAVFDYLTVRKKMMLNILEIKETQFSAGDVAYTCADAEIARTDYLYVDDHGGETLLGYSYLKMPWILRGMALVLGKNNGLVRGIFGRYKRIRVVLTDKQLRDCNRIRCYFLDKDGDRSIENWFRVNDLVRCQTWNVVSTKRNTFAPDFDDHTGNIYYWRKIVNVSWNTGVPRYLDANNEETEDPNEAYINEAGIARLASNGTYSASVAEENAPKVIDGKSYHWFDVAFDYDQEQEAFQHQRPTTWCDKNSDIPAAGDKVVQFGNTTDPDRMNIFLIEVNGAGNPDAPDWKMFRGVYTFDLNKCWWGGKTCCKTKWSVATGIKVYAPEFAWETEVGVAHQFLPRSEVYWQEILLEKDIFIKQHTEGTAEYDAYYPDYSDDILDGEGKFVSRGGYWINPVTKVSERGSAAHPIPKHYVRKAFFYDMLSHNGSMWLCSIVEQWYWVANESFEYDGVLYEKGCYVPDYASLPEDFKKFCERKPYYTFDEPTAESNNWTEQVQKGDPGAFLSRAFCRTNDDISNYTVHGGSYGVPLPTETLDAEGHVVHGIVWSDGIPQGDGLLWTVTAWFYGNGEHSDWSQPSLDADSNNMDVEFSPYSAMPVEPYGSDPSKRNSEEYRHARHEDGWFDPTLDVDYLHPRPDGSYDLPAGIAWTDMVWRAERRIKNTAYFGTWVITKIKGENAVRVDLTNENDSMLYSSSKGLVSGNVISVARMYNGSEDVSASAQWTVVSSKTGNVDDCIYTWDHATRTITVTGLNASGAITVTGVYTDINGAVYTKSTQLTLKKLVDVDKFELEIDPNDIAYNASTDDPPVKTVSVKVWKTSIDGVRALSVPPTGYKTCVYDPSSHITENAGSSFSFQIAPGLFNDITVKIAKGYDSTDILDLETIPINKTYNGHEAPGTEKVYIRTKENVAPVIVADSSAGGSAHLLDNYIPSVDGSGRTDIEINTGGTAALPICTASPKGVSKEWPYEWKAERKKGNVNLVTGRRAWNDYGGAMVLDGVCGADSIRIDLDNELDVVETNSEGKVTKDRYVFVRARVYEGGTPVECTFNTPSADLIIGATSCVVTPPTASNYFDLMWAFSAGNPDCIVTEPVSKTVTLRYKDEDYSAVFTLMPSLGQAFYQLLPKPSAVKRERYDDNPNGYEDIVIGMGVELVDGTEYIELNYTNWHAKGLVVRYSTESTPESASAGAELAANQLTLTDDVSDVYFALFNSDGELLDRESIPVMKDGVDPMPNIIDGTGFDHNMNVWTLSNGTVVNGGKFGQKAVHCEATTSGGYKDMISQVIAGTGQSGILKPATWYTLSYWVKGAAHIVSYIYTNPQGYAIDTTKKGYINGKETTLRQDAAVETNLSSAWKKVTLTFCTPAAFQYDVMLLFRAQPYYRDADVYLCCPKIEEGSVESPWCLSENDKRGADGNGYERVFMLTSVAFSASNLPTLDNANGVGNPSEDEFLPNVIGFDSNYKSRHWTDEPDQMPTYSWPILWVAERKYDGTSWGLFGDPIEYSRFQSVLALTLTRNNAYTDANWNTYASIGNSETYGFREGDSDFTKCRIGDTFTVVGTSSDSGRNNYAVYQCTDVSRSSITGTCLSFTHDGAGVMIDGTNSFVRFAKSATQPPLDQSDTRWKTTIEALSLAAGDTYWTWVHTAYTDSHSTDVCNPGYYGADAEIDTQNTFTKYSTVLNSSTQPDDNTFTLTSVPSTLSQGNYLWSLTQIKYVNVATPIKTYAVTRIGADGGNGYSLHTAYADDVTNPPTVSSASAVTNFSTTMLATSRFIGICVLKQVSTTGPDPDPTDPTVYSWATMGEHGINSAPVMLYQRYAATTQNPTPAKPNSSAWYQFSNGKLYTTESGSTETAIDSNKLNGWTRTIPNGTDPIYSIQATAANTTARDEIQASEWSDPVKYVENGSNGKDGWMVTADPANVILTQALAINTADFSTATVSFTAKKGSTSVAIDSIGTPASAEFVVAKKAQSGADAKKVLVSSPKQYTPQGETNAVYYTEGSFAVDVNVTDPDTNQTVTFPVTVFCYANLLGTWKDYTDESARRIAAETTQYEIDHGNLVKNDASYQALQSAVGSLETWKSTKEQTYDGYAQQITATNTRVDTAEQSVRTLTEEVEGVKTSESEIEQTARRISLSVLSNDDVTLENLLSDPGFTQSESTARWYEMVGTVGTQANHANYFTSQKQQADYTSITPFLRQYLRYTSYNIDRLGAGKWYTLSFLVRHTADNILSAATYTSSTSWTVLRTVYLIAGEKYSFSVKGKNSTEGKKVRVLITNGSEVSDVLEIPYTDYVIKNLEFTPSTTGNYRIQYCADGGTAYISEVKCSSSPFSILISKSVFSSENIICDGLQTTAPTSDGVVMFSAGKDWERHSITFKTASSLTASYALFFRFHANNTPVSILQPCLYADTNDGLKRTGIDIEAGKIDMTADNFTLRNLDGEQTMGVDENGNAEFAGTIRSLGGIYMRVGFFTSSNASQCYRHTFSDGYVIEGQDYVAPEDYSENLHDGSPMTACAYIGCGPLEIAYLQQWPNNNVFYIPNPSDYANKQMEIYKGDTTAAWKISCGNDAFDSFYEATIGGGVIHSNYITLIQTCVYVRLISNGTYWYILEKRDQNGNNIAI